MRFTFTHVYSTGSDDSTFEAVVRLADASGERSEYPVAVLVRDVAPQATVQAGTPVTAQVVNGTTFTNVHPGQPIPPGATTYLNLWSVQPGQPLVFTSVQTAYSAGTADDDKTSP
jgi:hypothetical protein